MKLKRARHLSIIIVVGGVFFGAACSSEDPQSSETLATTQATAASGAAPRSPGPVAAGRWTVPGQVGDYRFISEEELESDGADNGKIDSYSCYTVSDWKRFAQDGKSIYEGGRAVGENLFNGIPRESEIAATAVVDNAVYSGNWSDYLASGRKAPLDCLVVQRVSFTGAEGKSYIQKLASSMADSSIGPCESAQPTVPSPQRSDAFRGCYVFDGSTIVQGIVISNGPDFIQKRPAVADVVNAVARS